MADHVINGRLISELRVIDLRKALVDRNLSKTGTKDVLYNRLSAHLNDIKKNEETIEISQESSSSTDRPSSRSDDASTDTNDAVDDIEDEKKVKPLRLSMKISDLKQQSVSSSDTETEEEPKNLNSNNNSNLEDIIEKVAEDTTSREQCKPVINSNDNNDNSCSGTESDKSGDSEKNHDSSDTSNENLNDKTITESKDLEESGLTPTDTKPSSDKKVGEVISSNVDNTCNVSIDCNKDSETSATLEKEPKEILSVKDCKEDNANDINTNDSRNINKLPEEENKSKEDDIVNETTIVDSAELINTTTIKSNDNKIIDNSESLTKTDENSSISNSAELVKKKKFERKTIVYDCSPPKVQHKYKETPVKVKAPIDVIRIESDSDISDAAVVVTSVASVASPKKILKATEDHDSANSVTIGSNEDDDEEMDFEDGEDMPSKVATVEKSRAPRRPVRQPSSDVSIEEPVPRLRECSPARNNISVYVHVSHLVRPFTLSQLMLLLGRAGELSDSSPNFWIDKVKSHCFVQYKDEESSKKLREQLHGTKWPPSNPKCLRVDFSTQKMMNYNVSGRQDSKSEDIISRPTTLTEQISNGPEITKTKENYQTEKPKTVTNGVNESSSSRRSRSKERTDAKKKSESATVRRSSAGDDVTRKNRPEYREHPSDHKRRSGDYRNREEDSRKITRKPPTPEPSNRMLDDLFKKTIATPCLYYLPLSAIQIDEKESREKEKQELKRKNIEERRNRRNLNADSSNATIDSKQKVESPPSNSRRVRKESATATDHENKDRSPNRKRIRSSGSPQQTRVNRASPQNRNRGSPQNRNRASPQNRNRASPQNRNRASPQNRTNSPQAQARNYRRSSPPIRRRSSPNRKSDNDKAMRSRSPIRRRSRSLKRRSRSPVGRKTKSPIRRRTKSPIRRR